MNEIVLFEAADKSITLPVLVEKENVWLTRVQMAELFDRDIKMPCKKKWIYQLSQNLRQFKKKAKEMWNVELSIIIWI